MKMRLVLVLMMGVVVGLGQGQEQEFIDVVKNLLQGDELQKFQNVYSALPLEIRDKMTKDLMANPAQFGKDILEMVGPGMMNMVQNLASGFGKNLNAPGKPPLENRRGDPQNNEIETDDGMAMDYSKQGQAKVNKPSGGLDFGPLGSLLGNLISSNPQMLMNVVQGVMQGQGGQGFSFESITTMLSQNIDLDTVINMASSFAGSQLQNARGDGGFAKQAQGFADMLQLQQISQMWTDFIKSPTGQKVNRVLPRLLKAESLPDALRLIEKETQFRFDVILRQFQEPAIRKMFVSQLVRPIGQFVKGIKVPSDLKDVMARADDVLNNKMGLGVTLKEYIDPVTDHIRSTFKITKESLLDLSSEDVERIASDILNKEVLSPLSDVYNAYEKARENSQCAKFIFCQLNHNFYNENFIRRHVIKTSSIISAFQASAVMKKDAFSGLYEAIHVGADGFDCTHGTSNFCLDLMHTSSHNEL